MGVPTIADFRAQFPELSGVVGDPSIAAAIQIASLWFDESVWDPLDYKLAYLMWTAHYISLQRMQQQANQNGGGGNSELDLFISAVSFGDRRVSYSQRKGNNPLQNSSAFPGEQLLGLTLYGQLYQQIRARNVIPVVVL